MDFLPSNYDFDLEGTAEFISRAGAQKVALQFPEGLLVFSCIIAEILQEKTGAKCVIMGDVTYGACCIDDLTAKAMQCDCIIHYGHSQLVPDVIMSIPTFFVHVRIHFDTDRLLRLLERHFSKKHIVLLGTIQFTHGLVSLKEKMTEEHTFTVSIPQAFPLSEGEVLGCTCPDFPVGTDAFVFVADGRFHAESAMIAYPSLPAFRYDPYSMTLSKESFAMASLLKQREKVCAAARGAKTVGIVLGTLGRQGNPAVMSRLKRTLRAAGVRVVTLLLTEIFPEKLKLLEGTVDAWVQLACPRLSMDWGEAFSKPLLTSFEAFSVFHPDVLGWCGEGRVFDSLRYSSCASSECSCEDATKDIEDISSGGSLTTAPVERAEYPAAALKDGRYPMDWYRSKTGEWGNQFGVKFDTT